MPQQYKIWIAESYSCQKDIIQLLKSSNLSEVVTIYCSHHLIRPELELFSDHFFQQPSVAESAQWLLDQCIFHRINLLFCGKNSHFIELYRSDFEAHDIQLVTGAIGVTHHDQINHKYQFGLICDSLQLPHIPALLVDSQENLEESIQTFQAKYPEICAKPVHGVYGSGFVKLIDHLSYFENIQSQTVCNTQQFIQAYRQLDEPTPYLIMPFLTGQECSVDIACSAGKILTQVTRTKYNYFQECNLEHPCHAICIQLVQYFQCDGLINIQFKQDHDLNWYILEINPRPAGGFAYTQHTGVNLIAELIAHKLKINLNRPPQLSHVKVLPITQSVKLDF